MEVAYRNSNVRNAELGILPLRERTLVNLLETSRVSVDGLLFEVSDEAVHNLGGHEVGEEEAVEEEALGANDHGLHEPARLAHLHKGQEMHAFVVALLEEGFNPAVVSLHSSEAVEVTQHAAHHSWHASDTFEEDKSNKLDRVSPHPRLLLKSGSEVQDLPIEIQSGALMLQ